MFTFIKNLVGDGTERAVKQIEPLTGFDVKLLGRDALNREEAEDAAGDANADRINGTATRQWLSRMETTGRATFFLMDRANNWRWAQVWGRVVEDIPAFCRELVAALAE